MDQQQMDLHPNMSEESGPLCLNLEKTPSLLKKILRKLRLRRGPAAAPTGITQSADTKKANPPPISFLAKSLRIGSWERVARREAVIAAKFYFNMKKLVWVVHEGGSRMRFEMEWDDIAAIRATFGEGEPDVLEVELNEPPLFFCETGTEPGMHSNWEPAPDFTGEQASKFRLHYLEFDTGTLQPYYTMILRCEIQLQLLSQIPFTSHRSPYFEIGHELQGPPNVLDTQSSKVPPLHNQPTSSGDRYPWQPPHTGNPMVFAPHHIGNSEHLRTCEMNNRITAMGHCSSVIGCPPTEERGAHVMDPRYPPLDGVTKLPLVYGIAAMDPHSYPSTPLAHQEMQYLRRLCIVERIGFQSNEEHVACAMDQYLNLASLERDLMDDRDLQSTDNADAHLMRLFYREIGQADPAASDGAISSLAPKEYAI